MAAKLPRISVITPTLNQGKFLETTIKSVLNQEYPDLEYIVMDGGSTDNTLQILKKYSRKLKYYSGIDRGQSDAINNGIKKSTGEIICYINSDDYFEPGSLKKIGEFFKNNAQAHWVTGKCFVIDEKDNKVRNIITVYKNIFLKYLRSNLVFSIVQFISQPSTFWRREVVNNIGLFDISLHYDMDYDYWLRIWQKYPLFFIDEYIASYRVHDKAKAVISPDTQFKKEYEISKKYTKNKIILFLHKLHFLLALKIYKSFFIKK